VRGLTQWTKKENRFEVQITVTFFLFFKDAKSSTIGRVVSILQFRSRQTAQSAVLQHCGA